MSSIEYVIVDQYQETEDDCFVPLADNWTNPDESNKRARPHWSLGRQRRRETKERLGIWYGPDDS